MKTTGLAFSRVATYLAFALMSAGLSQVAAAADAPAAHKPTLQEMQDRVEIEGVMWRYARALDTLDVDGYAAVYTEDGQFGTGDKATKGHEALKKMVLGLKKSRDERAAKGEKSPGTLHMEANHDIEFQDKDHATYNAYWMTMYPAQGAENPARLAAVGRSIDQLVRVNGKWLIKLRDVAPQD
jgi:SnoaL-like domain